MIRCCTLIEWPNYLKIVPSGVANCHNLPSGGGTKRPLVWDKVASSIEGKRMESPPTFIRGKRRKKQKDDGLHILKMRVRKLFTHGTIKCANMTSKLCIFLFNVFMYFSLFYIF